MPTVWMSLRRSLQCKSEPGDVYDPKSRNNFDTTLTRKLGRSGCSRSLSNLKDVIHGSKRYIEKPPICSPRSIGSSELVNPISHEVILNNSRCELKISGHNADNGSGGGVSTFMGTLKPGTPGPGELADMRYQSPQCRSSASPLKKPPNLSSGRNILGGSGSSSMSNGVYSNGSTSTCHKCGEQFVKWEAAEAHHLSKHAVTELVEGDSSRKIVEIICRTSLLKSDNHCVRIERVLKVHNMQKTLSRFEDYREVVKLKASKLPKKHPRCLADGNELLRFHGTTLACSLGTKGSSNLCLSDTCNVCRILRNGFSAKKELKDDVGVFTTSTSGRAFESVQLYEEEVLPRKALIVCRVIAGRVHRPLENFQELNGQTGFDSLAGKVGLHSNIEELYLLNSRALLPCFVVICKR